MVVYAHIRQYILMFVDISHETQIKHMSFPWDGQICMVGCASKWANYCLCG